MQKTNEQKLKDFLARSDADLSAMELDIKTRAIRMEEEVNKLKEHLGNLVAEHNRSKERMTNLIAGASALWSVLIDKE